MKTIILCFIYAILFIAITPTAFNYIDNLLKKLGSKDDIFYHTIAYLTAGVLILAALDTLIQYISNYI